MTWVWGHKLAFTRPGGKERGGDHCGKSPGEEKARLSVKVTLALLLVFRLADLSPASAPQHLLFPSPARPSPRAPRGWTRLIVQLASPPREAFPDHSLRYPSALLTFWPPLSFLFFLTRITL